MIHVLDGLSCNDLAFSLQDVDNALEYVIVLKELAKELTDQMELEHVPEVYEKEDETGYYIVICFDTFKESLNYVDLFLSLMTDPDVDCGLEHLQLFTLNTMVYQRFSNAKQEMLTNFAYNLFADLNEEGSLSTRLLSLESIVEYNAVPKLRTILNVMAHAMENNGIEVTEKMNQVSVPTYH